MKVRLLTLFLILFVTAGSLFAQDDLSDPLAPKKTVTPIYIGPVIGYNRSIHTVELKTFAADPLCPTFVNGAANGFFAGLSFEYLLGNVVNSKSSIIVKALYNSLPVSLMVTGDIYPSRIIDTATGTEKLIFTETENNNEVTYNVITVETFYRLNLLGTGLGVFVGPTFDFALTKTHDQSMSLIEPDYVQFKKDPNSPYKYSDDLRTITVSEGDIPQSNAFRLGLKAGVQYEIPMGKFMVIPHVSYNFGITNLTSQEDWRVNALQIGLDLRYALRLF